MPGNKLELENQAIQAIFTIIEKEYRPRKNSVHALSRDAGVTARTAAHWFAREHIPRTSQLLMLMSKNARIAQALAEVFAAIAASHTTNRESASNGTNGSS